MIISDDFRAHFDPEELAELDRDSAVIFGLRRDLTLALMNEAWFRFARENGATQAFFEEYGLGASYLQALPSPVRDFFAKRVRDSMKRQERWAFDYLCPGKDTLQKFRMKVFPLEGGVGCLVSNSLIVELPHPDETGADLNMIDAYVGANNIATQCCHCQRIRLVADPTRWDWVPRLVDQMPNNISHSICPTCFTYFYPSEEGDEES